LIARAG